MSLKSILIATPRTEAFASLAAVYGEQTRITTVGRASDLLAAFSASRQDCSFIDIDFLIAMQSSGRADPEVLLAPLLRQFPTADIVILCSRDRRADAVAVLRGGAAGQLLYPVNPEEVRYLTESLEEKQRERQELEYLRRRALHLLPEGVGESRSASMRQVLRKLRSVAGTGTTVLLTGETGTGKGVMARLIHHMSRRREERFLSVHCGAIPENLVESELFGHEKGAFTGAVKRKMGKFEIADGGTLFLDEIGTIASPVQIKLLQVLQERTFSRVGGETEMKTDTRVVAATNNDLAEMVAGGGFRKDLYYRLHVFPVELPPLRERREDIPLLANTLLARLETVQGKGIREIHPDVIQAFFAYEWPGNIREMENLMERAYILETGEILSPDGFPVELFSGASHATVPLEISGTLAAARKRAVEMVERQYLEALLGEHRGRIKSSAEAAGVTTRQLHKLMTRYGIRKEAFK